MGRMDAPMPAPSAPSPQRKFFSSFAGKSLLLKCVLLKWKIERAQFIPKKTVSSQLRNPFATGPKGLLLGLGGGGGASMEH